MLVVLSEFFFLLLPLQQKQEQQEQQLNKNRMLDHDAGFPNQTQLVVPHFLDSQLQYGLTQEHLRSPEYLHEHNAQPS